MIGYLLDTSVLIDLGDHRRPRHLLTRRWFDNASADELFVSTVSVGELARGIAALADGAKRRRQEHHLHRVVIPSFRVVAFDLEASLRWGALMGEGQRAGQTPPNDDAKIAAIATTHGLTVVTSNARDFEPLGVPWLDPTRP